jgi:hypothetical protein
MPDFSTDFSRWMLARCSVAEGQLTSTARLHNDFAMWSLDKNVAYIRRDTFETLLRSAGVTCEGRLIFDFCLTEDLPRKKSVDDPVPEPALQKGSITAAQLLEDLLRDGPRSTSVLRSAAELARFSWASMLAAKRALGVESPAPSIWELPR